ncbi:sigma-70 family RNA polymerase sigma factor [Athalassotoga sp.]|uniref:sigma-70 family RNA polymerase sigma factor n=1 Tax=Athalassotoga sp. TaxID=2022597 RepID=UPI003D0430D0
MLEDKLAAIGLMDLDDHLCESNEDKEIENIRFYSPRDNLISSYMNEIKNIPLLTPEKEKTLAIRISRGDKHARDEFILSNLRLVVSIARHYMGLGLPFLDLVQEGNISLMRAVDKFDWKMGYRFSTYASYWIRKGMSRAIASKGKGVKIPVHTLEKIGRMKKIEGEYLQKYGEYPDIEYIAYEMELPKDKVEQMKAIKETLSLDRVVDENATLEDFVADEDAQSPEEYAYREELHDQMEKIVDTLDPKEAMVVKMRYGLNGPRQTLDEIGRQFGITRERVRQIEVKAMKKLRKSLGENAGSN